ncbi:MAG: hypothetical protein KY455_03675 [Euryarchaeota archaeon]|nr:hypothetical protein [Euryarchaeota archaeon]
MEAKAKVTTDKTGKDGEKGPKKMGPPFHVLKKKVEVMATSTELLRENGENEATILMDSVALIDGPWMQKVNGVWECTGGSKVCVLDGFVDKIEVAAEITGNARTAMEAGLATAKAAWKGSLTTAAKIAAHIQEEKIAPGTEITYGFRLEQDGRLSLVILRDDAH